MKSAYHSTIVRTRFVYQISTKTYFFFFLVLTREGEREGKINYKIIIYNGKVKLC